MLSASSQPKVCGKSKRVRKWSRLLLLTALSSTWTHGAWDTKYFNPAPQADDVVLPMPCDGSMVFRKVVIPLPNPMDDYPITLGQEGGAWGFLEQAHGTHIAGSFTETGNSKSRYYLLAKYEINQAQYQALTQEKCTVPSIKQRLPQLSISWFDAVNAADHYNLWLREHAKNQLPKEDGVEGFLRLPTESEWEFAARGGIAVSPAEFREDRFPMPDGINSYVWFAGSQSSNGKAQFTGLSKPNPLGLHDMLGNADEMVFEPFRLNKLDRLHGQAGGFIVRGGNYLTPMSDIRSSLRQEEPFYQQNTHNAPKTSGFRLVVTAPTLTSRDRIKQIEKAWSSLGMQNKQTGADNSNTDPVSELNSIVDNVQDSSVKLQLEKLRSELRANIQSRDEQRDRAIRSSLQLGAFLCTKLKDDGLFFDHLSKIYNLDCSNPDPANKICSRRKQQLDEHKNVLNFILNYYADTVVDAGLNYDAGMVTPQMGITAQELTARGKSNLVSYLNTHWDHLKHYFESGNIARQQWLDTCKSI